MVRRLLELGVDVNQRCEDPWLEGSSPLHLAVYMRSLEMARLLLDGGADLNQTDANGLMPQHICIHDATVPLAELLLSRGADKRTKSRDGLAYQRAAQIGEMKSMVVWLPSGVAAPGPDDVWD
jgi:ankyrin repeat protein